MRRSAMCAVAVLGLVFTGSLPAMLRRQEPPPVREPAVQPAAVRPVRPAATIVAPPLVEVAGPAEYARMLDHVLRFEWRQASSIARRYVDLVDGRDRTEYVQGLLYRLRMQRISSLNDLATGTADCARCAGCSLHNLMLFFRHQGTPGWRKLGMPTRLVYERGLKLAPADVTLAVCRAGLLVDLDQAAEAERVFPRPPEDLAALTTSDVVNMAYYHAARGDRAQLLVWLTRAMDRDAAHTSEWAAESDDLDAFRDDADVMRLVSPR
jgi:hypothetical protein